MSAIENVSDERLRMFLEPAPDGIVFGRAEYIRELMSSECAIGFVASGESQLRRRRKPDAIARFWSAVDLRGPLPVDRPDLGCCWQWQRTLTEHGYGQLKAYGRNWRVHCFAYALLVGSVPDGLVLDHVCRNRGCVNPRHLEPVTDAVNILRGVSFAATNAAKTHCKYGHEFTPENTRVGRLGRACVECNRISAREFARRKRRAAATRQAGA